MSSPTSTSKTNDSDSDSNSPNAKILDTRPHSSQTEIVEINTDNYNVLENGDKPLQEEREEVAGEKNDEASLTHPYIGQEVRIQKGPSEGMITKILAVKTRGWWKLAGVDGFIHSRRCILLNEVPEKEMIDWYEKRGMKYHPSSAKFQKDISHTEEEEDGDMPTMEENSVGKSLRGMENSKKKRKFPVEEPFRMIDLLNGSSTSPIHRIYCDPNYGKLKYSCSSKMSTVTPVILHFDEDKVPFELQHLKPSKMLDVFDRKTGKIKSGITVQDLPHTLRQNANYEVLFPISSSQESSDLELPRQCRSDKNTQISATVLPQKPFPHFGLEENNNSMYSERNREITRGLKSVEGERQKISANSRETGEMNINSVFEQSLELTMK